MTVMTLRLPDNVLARIDKEAETLGLSRPEYIRILLEEKTFPVVIQRLTTLVQDEQIIQRINDRLAVLEKRVLGEG